jgi:hypothetical protein
MNIRKLAFVVPEKYVTEINAGDTITVLPSSFIGDNF